MHSLKTVANLLGLVSAALLSACAVPVGTEEDTSTTGEEITITTAVTPSGQLASSARRVLNAFGTQHGWTKQDVRLFGDIDGDGDKDIVGIDETGVYFSKYQPARSVLQPPSFATPYLVQNHLRTTGFNPILLGAIDYDNKQDILGFGADGVYAVHTAADTNHRFIQRVSVDFGTDHGWGSNHPRLLGDANGDGFDDIVGFGNAGVYVSYSLPNVFAFTEPAFLVNNFGYDQAWRVDKHLRVLADVNNDGRKDIVGFGDAGVYLSLATATGFSPATFVLAKFGYNAAAGGWRINVNPRVLADVNGDRKSDIVGFGSDGVYVSLSTGSGFSAPTRWSISFGANGGWQDPQHPRFVVDRNGDGRADIVGFANAGMYVATSTGTTFNTAQNAVPNLGASAFSYSTYLARMVDFSNTGLANAIVFGADGVWSDMPAPASNLPVLQLASP
jgi:hypothetical protein